MQGSFGCISERGDKERHRFFFIASCADTFWQISTGKVDTFFWLGDIFFGSSSTDQKDDNRPNRSIND
jgi:hypothetical protein